ncbi:MAG: hypothetical protein ACRDOI_14400 [Trebonia sp.]
MNRVIAVAATFAMAAPRPATAHPATHAKTAQDAKTGAQAKAAAARRARLANQLPTQIGSDLDRGKYVTVVRCQGVDSPPPVRLARPGSPLMVNGTGHSAAILAMLKKPNPYKTIYTCTVVVKEKVPAKAKKAKTGCEITTGGHQGSGRTGKKGCTKPVTLNTGFGGLAPRVSGHHPAR